jgi:hypothetical protein
LGIFEEILEVSNLFTFQENILQLPVEMIAEILSYVLHHCSVSMTCKKFHEISCGSKFLQLKFCTEGYSYSAKSYTRFLEDDRTFRSIMKSSRRFNRLKMSDDSDDRPDAVKVLRLKRLAKVLQRFGNDIKEVDFGSIEFPPNIVDLLNFMPNLKKIRLEGIYYYEDTIINKGELKLHKLKQFESHYCGHKVLQIFNQLPSGVLQEILLGEIRDLNTNSTKQETDVIPKLFINQHNIKKVNTSLQYTGFLDWSGTKIKLLCTSPDHDEQHTKELLVRLLTGQDEMEQFYCHYVDLLLLKPIIGELKSLEELHIITRKPCVEGIPELSKLHKLKTLDIQCHDHINPPSPNIISFLNLTRNSSVEELKVYCKLVSLPDFTIIQLSVNFPSVKELTLHSKSTINVINTILQNFPNLESLHFYPYEIAGEAYIYQEGLRPQNLKKLHIGSWDGNINHEFAKLFGSCTIMEEFSAMSAITKGSLTEMLTLQPNLKSIKIFEYIMFRAKLEKFPKSHVTRTDIEAIKKNGKNLKTFQVKFCVFEDEISLEKLQEEFNDQFDTVEMKFNSCNSSYMWKMEKTSKQP